MLIAVQQQDEITVHLNADGVVVIRQSTPDSDLPELVALLPQNVEALIRALRAAKRESVHKEREQHA